ncbi:MAG: cadherin domain-containing protein, partial [Ekhidna sp.]|nr:cadherin domain-containing protein [Ekhidna sp.]
SLSAMITVTINVTDVNDNAPEITSDNAKSVAENTTAVLTVVATDADATAMITYSLSGGTDRSSFSIDAVGGALTFNSAPDFEAKGSVAGNNIYEVEVTAGDGDNSDTQMITVTVTDVNEAPVFSSGSFTLTIGEDAATDANVGAAVAAVDPDEDGVTYTLTGEDSGDFSIDGNGQITVASTLDRETTSSYTLTVTATDDDATNSLSATAAVTINVTDVNDNAPKITSDNAKKVAENTTTVLTVVATDADANTTLTYSLSGGSDRSSFSIDAGMLRRRSPLRLPITRMMMC